MEDSMDTVYDDCFVVYSHADSRVEPPGEVEHEMTACATYEEACRFRQEFERRGQLCIIRWRGETGGGD
jgi:hypothetical protein